MQRCVAPRRSALSLSLLSASPKLHLRTIVYICSQRLSMVVRSPNKSTSRPRYGVSARSVQWRAALPRGQFLFSTSAIKEMRPSPMVGNSRNKRTVASCLDEVTRARKTVARTCPVSLAVLPARCAPIVRKLEQHMTLTIPFFFPFIFKFIFFLKSRFFLNICRVFNLLHSVSPQSCNRRNCATKERKTQGRS